MTAVAEEMRLPVEAHIEKAEKVVGGRWRMNGSGQLVDETNRVIAHIEDREAGALLASFSPPEMLLALNELLKLREQVKESSGGVSKAKPKSDEELIG